MKKTVLFTFVLTLALSVNGQVALTKSIKNTTIIKNKPTDPPGTMKDAYDVSGYMVKERLKSEDKNNTQIIDRISKNDLVVIDGTYDHMHLVLNALKLPYIRITQEQLKNVKLEPHQTVFVNCASGFPPERARQLASFVSQGGQLITTDWALQNVLEIGFPGYVSYNKRATSDEVVRIEVMDKDDSVIKGFLDEETAPVWWLEGSSYPIKVLNKEKVKVLIKSKELKDKYGEEAVLIRFNHGKGTVYHMISHFYLQRTETKDSRQTMNSNAYITSKGISITDESEVKKQAEKLDYGTVQSANTSSEFIMRAVVKQKNKNLK